VLLEATDSAQPALSGNGWRELELALEFEEAIFMIDNWL
jgi:hypothetical protein